MLYPLPRTLHVLVVATLLLGASGCIWALPPQHDIFVKPNAYHDGLTILYNGRVFTSNQDRLWAEAIVLERNRIIAVGSTNSLLKQAQKGALLIDLKGKLLIPGLNNAHVHAPITIEGHSLDTGNVVFTPGPSAAEMLSLIEDAVARIPAGTWIHGVVGFRLFEEEQLDRFQLDAVAPNHPVKLLKFAGHGTIFNTNALNLLSIAEDAPNPLGGFMGRVPGSNILNGYFHEYAEWNLAGQALGNLLSDERVIELYQSYVLQSLVVGTTSIQNMSNNLNQVDNKRILEKAALPIRWRSICFPGSFEESCYGFNAAPADSPDGMVSYHGKKWIIDGSPIERGAQMTEPYTDRPETSGLTNFSDAELKRILQEGLRGDPGENQLLFHAVGDKSIERILLGMKELAPATAWKDRRIRIEHCDMLRPDLRTLFKQFGVIYVQNASHFSLRFIHEARFGPERAKWAFPLRSLLEAGIPIAMGSDAVGIPDNPFVDLMSAVTHPFHPHEAISMEQAVMAYTTGSAYAEFQEHQKGMLKPGMLADLTVLNQDIFRISPQEVPHTRSILTIVDGRIAYDAGVLSLKKVSAPSLPNPNDPKPAR